MEKLVEKLYIKNAFLKEFHANIIKNKLIDEKPAFALDKTAFYPTSGGQMNDTGTINGVKVLDVFQENGQIWHVLEGDVDLQNVKGKIDWNRRFDFMQQHTGFHLLAQSFLRKGNVVTLSSHLGEEYSTIDVELNAHSPDLVAEVEMLANNVVWENRMVKSFEISKQEIKNYKNIRKIQEDFDNIRLVEIEDFDLDPCGGTHVSSTGQVGLIKILGYEKVRGMLRYSFVAGKRAYREFSFYQDYLNAASKKLTTGFAGVPESVTKMHDENKKYKKSISQIEDELLDLMIDVLLSDIKYKQRKVLDFKNKSLDFLRKAASKIIKERECSIALISMTDQISLVMASSMGDNLRPVLESVLALMDGQGGGSPNFVQAGGKNVTRLEQTIKEIEKQFAELDN